MPDTFDSRCERISQVFDRKLFFVCGAPKSGTTWVQRMLDSHPEVICSGEGHFTDAVIPPLNQLFNQYTKTQKLDNERVYQGNPYYETLTKDDFAFIAKSFIGMMLSQRAIAEETRCIGDKTPLYTLRMPMLANLFPEARFIHVIRDGRDVITSVAHHAYRAGHRAAIDKERPEYLTYAAQNAQTWAKHIQAATQFGRNNPDKYIAIRYEDLLADSNSSLGKLFDFLEVSTDTDIVSKCIEDNDFKAQSGGREPGEQDKDSYFRSGQAGDWENFLSNSALKGVYPHAKKFLHMYGYLQEDNAPSE